MVPSGDRGRGFESWNARYEQHTFPVHLFQQKPVEEKHQENSRRSPELEHPVLHPLPARRRFVDVDVYGRLIGARADDRQEEEGDENAVPLREGEHCDDHEKSAKQAPGRSVLHVELHEDHGMKGWEDEPEYVVHAVADVPQDGSALLCHTHSDRSQGNI